MGQQQLLLLLLSTVIVGLAVVVGIEAFEEGSFRARQDQYTGEAVALAGEVVAWQMKPSIIGGNENSADVSRLSMASIGREETGVEGGSYFERDGNRYTLNGEVEGRPLVTASRAVPEKGDVLVEIAMWGAEGSCWATRYRYFDGSAFTSPTDDLDNPGGCSWE